MTNREKYKITVNSERDKDIQTIAIKFGKYLIEHFNSEMLDSSLVDGIYEKWLDLDIKLK